MAEPATILNLTAVVTPDDDWFMARCVEVPSSARGQPWTRRSPTSPRPSSGPASWRILAWEPRFEVVHRRIVPAACARERVRDPDDVATRISQRALVEARLG
jgi:hypothetical protein